MKIKDVKKKIRHENWREEISECQSSGLKVKEWCRKKGLNTNTYYNRLRVIREEILALSESEVQEIVPVSISKEISVSDTENTASSTASVSERDKAVIRKGDIEIELPEKITQDMVLMFLRGLKEIKKENIYIVCGQTDMRKSIDGLAAIVEQKCRLDPFTESLFLFCGRKKDRLKALLWEGDGFLLMYKRLETGSFTWPKNADEVKKLTQEQFIWLMQGLSIDQPKAIKKIRGRIDIC